LEQVARRQAGDTDVEVTVDIDPETPFPRQEMLFALGRELLTNAAKHARADHIRLTLNRDGERVNLEVVDDGCGIAEGRMREAVLGGHVGLAAVGERVAARGGTLTISSAPGAGTSVRITLPQPDAAAASTRLRWRAADVSDRVTPRDTLQASPA
jgi:two-component system NarL family sensor kinase